MVAFRFVLSCSIAPSLLIDGVVVEKNKQLGMDDYYEDNYEASYITPNPICPKDTRNRWTYIGEKIEDPWNPIQTNQQAFAKKNFLATEANGDIVEALKRFLFDRGTDDSLPKLFAKPNVNGLDVGDNTCGNSSNWVSIKYLDDPKYVCSDCGYNMKDDEGKKVIKDIVGFANEVNQNKKVTETNIPDTWCHNPFPMMNFTGLSETQKETLRGSWRGTGGYYNVLKCKTSNYSVIGFAAEKQGTCYPFHTHKSYELYWTIGGKAVWKAGKPPKEDGTGVHTFTKYKMNDATHELHKHDPMITHEMVTPVTHTTQIYFWSMSGYDNLGVNNYDADSKNVIFGHDADGNGQIDKSEEHDFPVKSCYNDVKYGHIGAGVAPHEHHK